MSLLAVGVISVLSTSLLAQHTYYISKSAGSDSNTSAEAQSQSTPWAHLPGMPSCAGYCKSHIPVAGDRFILKGGDTWGASDLGVAWQWAGTSAAPIYVGVDSSWWNTNVCGGSWCRPIFNAGQTSTADASDMFINVWTNANWTVFDNIELTGQDGGGSYIYVTAPNIEVKNMYCHGWATGQDNSGACVLGNGNTVGSSVHDGVIDGSDTNKNFGNGIIHMPVVYNMVIRYVVSGLLGAFNRVHDVLVEFPVLSCCGDHANGIFVFGPASGTSLIMYNDVVRHTTACSGCVNMWFNGNAGANSSLVAYGFNNVLYDLNPSNIFITGGHPPGPSGTFTIFNNTIECGTDASLVSPCFGNGETGNAMTVNSANNHAITDGGGVGCSVNGVGCATVTTDFVQSLSVAHSQGYSSAQTYAFSPTSASGSTAGAGTNVGSSMCAGVSALDHAAGIACLSDTSYACGYNVANHTVSCPARAVNARPSAGAWDVGAYQFTGTAGTGSPNPPRNLTATPH